MDEETLQPVEAVGQDDLPPLIEGQLDVLGAETLDRLELRLGRVVRHDDATGNAELVRGVCQTLGHVPGACGVHTLGKHLGARQPHGIRRAADLEGSDRLEVLELQVDLGRCVLDVQTQKRCPQRQVRDSRPGRADLADRDLLKRFHGVFPRR